MSVPVSKRGETGLEADHHLHALRDEITDFILLDFGYSKEKNNEKMVYGCSIFEQAVAGTVIPTRITCAKTQLPLFALDPSKITNRAAWWLRDVVSASYFAFVGSAGNAYCSSAGAAGVGVRPAFAIK